MEVFESLIIKSINNQLKATNKNLVAQAEELVKDRTNQADNFAKKLEEKLAKHSGKSSEFEAQITGSLNQLKTDLKDLKVKGVVFWRRWWSGIERS